MFTWIWFFPNIWMDWQNGRKLEMYDMKFFATIKLVCLFVWGLSSPSRMFHSYGGIAITGEGLQILTYARHSWPLSSEGSLACHALLWHGHPFIMVVSEDPTHTHTSSWAFSTGSVTTCFYELGLAQLRFEHLNFRLRGQHSNPLRHSRIYNKVKHHRNWFSQITYQ